MKHAEKFCAPRSARYSAHSSLTLIAALFAFLCLTQELHAQTGKTVPEKSYSIDETVRELGANLSWEPFFASGVLFKEDQRLKFYCGNPGDQGFVLFGGRELFILPLPYLESGTLRFPEAFIKTAKARFSQAGFSAPGTPSSPAISGDPTSFRIAAIIIDPGHGGRDPGASGTHTVSGKTLNSVEKDIVLDVSKKLAARLGAAYPGKKILLTRSGDTFPSLESRVTIANTVPLKDNEAIIYISIHANASLTKSARGYEVWYLPPETRRELIDRNAHPESAEVAHILNDMLQAEFITESTRMGRFILDRFHESFGNKMPSRGLKAENWYVVRNARMPAILVELGFVTNVEDAKLMADETYLKLYSEAFYKGIADFVAEFEQSGGYTAP
jgi:N-acetylmuramoyl-L-alanine amidase